MNMAIIYGVITVLSLILFLGYCWVVHKKDVWFVLLYISVFVVNLGYFSLSISKTLGEAMLANRISYLGSVFLPLFMLMIIMDACKMKYSKFMLGLLMFISTATFLLAASGGYLDWYYKEVTITIVNGAATLNKVYGPLHNWYFAYLALYFGMMIGVTIISFLKKKLVSYKHALLLVSLVFGNIAIWFIEQMIHWDFEFLSVSYIVTELYLLLLYDILQDYETVYSIVTKREHPVQATQKLEVIKLIETIQETVSETDEHEPAECAVYEEVEFTQEEQVVYESAVHTIEEYTVNKAEKNDMENAEEYKNRNGIVSENPSENREALLQTLTSRELDVLKYILEDKKRKDIAEELNVSENTIKKHTSHIFAKLKVSNRKELFEILDIRQ